jgi:hypothetical protein
MTATETMIRRIRDIQIARPGWSASGTPTLWDINLGRMLCYLRWRHFRDTGHMPPI